MILNLFLSVLFSSAAVVAASLGYLAAERLFQRHFNPRTGAFALKMIILLQPVMILLALLVFISGINLHGENLQEANLCGAHAKAADLHENSEIMTESELSETSMESVQSEIGNEIGSETPTKTAIKAAIKAAHGVASKENGRTLFDFTAWVTPMTYAAYAWLIMAVALMTQKSVAYSKFKRHIRQGRLHPAVFNASTKIYRSRFVNSPLLIGCFRPFIILPNMDMSDFELSLIIRHESIHLKNRDIPYKFALEFLRCINWFNPLITVVRKKFNLVTEFIADDMVTESLSAAQRKEYGLLLLKFSENNIKNRPGVYSYFSEDAQNLADRLEAIMKKEKNRKINKRIAAFIIGIAVIAVSVGVYITSDAYVSTAQAVESPDRAIGNTAQASNDTAQATSNFDQSNEKSAQSLSSDKVLKVGRLIYDDGNVQIFDGPVDESIPCGLAEVGKNGDINGKVEEARRIVLETGEYRAEAEAGEPIYALCGGTVTSSKYEQGYGYCVTVEDEEGFLWKYAHCSELLARSGDRVSEGDVLALAGKTGYAERDTVFIRSDRPRILRNQ